MLISCNHDILFYYEFFKDYRNSEIIRPRDHIQQSKVLIHLIILKVISHVFFHLYLKSLEP